MLNRIISEAKTLSHMPPEAATVYETFKGRMIEQVDRELTALPAIHVLIGHNPLSMMCEHHRNHARLMLGIFALNRFDLLAGAVPWSYRTCHAHGFSYEYFRVEMEAWKRAVARHIDGLCARAILEVYDWILRRHGEMIQLAEQSCGPPIAAGSPLDETRHAFLSAMLAGDLRECLRLAGNSAATPQGLESFYLEVVQRCMHELGRLWEQGEISVVQENLATAMMSGAMATIRPRVRIEAPERGKAVVTSAPNETHTLGAWLISGLLSLDGWEVDYLGAASSLPDIIDVLLTVRPDLLAISVAMPYNLHPAMKLMAAVRKQPALAGVKIMIGGYFTRIIPGLDRLAGADAVASDAKSAIALAREWRRSCTG